MQKCWTRRRRAERKCLCVCWPAAPAMQCDLRTDDDSMRDTLEVEDGKKGSFAEKLGMHPGLAIGYLGLLLFMIGDGVEAGFLSLLLVDLHFSTEKVALVFSAYGATAALASWLSGALTDIFGPKKIMWAGLLIWLRLGDAFSAGRHCACELHDDPCDLRRASGWVIRSLPTGSFAGWRQSLRSATWLPQSAGSGQRVQAVYPHWAHCWRVSPCH